MDAVEKFNQLVDSKMARQSKPDRFAAIRTVAKQNPALHQAYLVASNPGKKAKRLVSEKYDT